MLDRESVFDVLTPGHVDLLARRMGAFSGRSILDVGCGDGSDVLRLHKRGASIKGLEDLHKSSPDCERIHCGSPAAEIPFAVHAFDVVLLRGTQLFSSMQEGPELTIALANLLSCLKPRGRLVIPYRHVDERILACWREQLAPFSVSPRVRPLTGGLWAMLTLAKLRGKDFRMTAIEFPLGRKPVSRLEWHRLARESVMSRLRNPPAAA